MSEHGPTPYRPEDTTKRGAWIADANGSWVALACGETDAEGVANTAFIVRACNAFEGMLDALQVVRMSAGWSSLPEETQALVVQAIEEAESGR